MPSVRRGSSNPTYHDDPDWYERPGETVHLDYTPQPSQFAVNWGKPKPITSAQLEDMVTEVWSRATCGVCGRQPAEPNGLCAYCSRAQAADAQCEATRQRNRGDHPYGQFRLREPWER
jgi:hypothetical protein